MIYEYGSYLMTSHNLWQLGIDYLDCCVYKPFLFSYFKLMGCLFHSITRELETCSARTP